MGGLIWGVYACSFFLWLYAGLDVLLGLGGVVGGTIIIVTLLDRTLNLACTSSRAKAENVKRCPKHPSRFATPRVIGSSACEGVTLGHVMCASSGTSFGLANRLMASNVVADGTPSFLDMEAGRNRLSGHSGRGVVSNGAIADRCVGNRGTFTRFG